jgi:hypothetical protein
VTAARIEEAALALISLHTLDAMGGLMPREAGTTTEGLAYSFGVSLRTIQLTPGQAGVTMRELLESYVPDERLLWWTRYTAWLLLQLPGDLSDEDLARVARLAGAKLRD